METTKKEWLWQLRLSSFSGLGAYRATEMPPSPLHRPLTSFMSDPVCVDVAIIGAGPVGLFVVFQAGMLGMRSCVFDTLPVLGGQCAVLYPQKNIYDIPAFPCIKAIELVENLVEQARPFDPIYYTSAQVTELIPKSEAWLISAENAPQVLAKVVVVASGSGSFTPNKPPLENLVELEQSGALIYKVDDVSKFTGAEVVIVGGGDSALDWAIEIARVAKRVTLVHRRSEFRGHDHTVEKVHSLSREGIVDLITPAQLLQAEKSPTSRLSVTLQFFGTGSLRNLEADFLLTCYGMKSCLGSLAAWGIELNDGRVVVDQGNYSTSLAGVYAVGDAAVYNGRLRLILTGFAEAASAIHHAYSRVFPGKVLRFAYSTRVGVPGR